MAQPRASEEFQNLAHRLTGQLNQSLGKNHYSYHVLVADKKDNNGVASYHLKLKSNDGELYEADIDFLAGSETPSRLNTRPLLKEVELDPLHQEKIDSYMDLINQTYKASNAKYTITKIQQQLDDETSFVYRVKGDVDGKTYKIKIERPVVKPTEEPPLDGQTAAQS